MSSFKKRIEDLESEVLEKLISLVKSSDVESKSRSTPAIQVNVFDYVELVVVNDTLTFLDDNGDEFSLYADATIYDLIDILDEEVAERKIKITKNLLKSEMEELMDNLKGEIPGFIEYLLRDTKFDINRWRTRHNRTTASEAVLHEMLGYKIKNTVFDNGHERDAYHETFKEIN
jgi:hypothetical protein